MKMDQEEKQQAILKKISSIRKINLLIGFSEATLATELDSKREHSKKVFNLEWEEVSKSDIALQLFMDMKINDDEIERQFQKIQALRIKLTEEEDALIAYFKHERGLKN
jgi:hypothetical protein